MLEQWRGYDALRESPKEVNLNPELREAIKRYYKAFNSAVSVLGMFSPDEGEKKVEQFHQNSDRGSISIRDDEPQSGGPLFSDEPIMVVEEYLSKAFTVPTEVKSIIFWDDSLDLSVEPKRKDTCPYILHDNVDVSIDKATMYLQPYAGPRFRLNVETIDALSEHLKQKSDHYSWSGNMQLVFVRFVPAPF